MHDNDKMGEDLFPAFKSNDIPIVLVSSEYYVPYVSVLVESIKMSASKNNCYDIIIFHNSIHKELQEQLKHSIAGSSNISIRFFNAGSIMNDSNLFIADKNYSIEAYYRILTPWILKNYNKAIVMDSDLVVLHDIADLFKIDIKDFSLGAVKDIAYQGFLNGAVSGTLEYATKTLKLKKPYNYVNTGVMLMNLERIRKKTSEHELISFCENHHFNIQEQDGLNVFFEDDIWPIDLRWNFYVEVNSLISLAIDSAPEQGKKEYRSLTVYSKVNFPFIVHYANQPKPWINPQGKYADIWWKFAQKSSFYPIILYRMAQSICTSFQPVLRDDSKLQTPQCSFARRVSDKLLPKGSYRREALKKVIPRDSPQWNFLKKLYHKITF